MKKLPETIYIYKENEGRSNEYLEPHTTLQDIAVVGERIKVGMYRLEEMFLIEAEVKKRKIK